MFEKGNASWLSELPSVFKLYNKNLFLNCIIKFTIALKSLSFKLPKTQNEREFYFNCQDDREILTENYQLGQLVRTADFKRVFTKGDSTNYSYKLYTITEVIRDTIPSYRLNYVSERYNENPLLPTKLSQVFKELKKKIRKLKN